MLSFNFARIPKSLSSDSAHRLRCTLVWFCAGISFFLPEITYAQAKPAGAGFAALSKRAAEARDADRLPEAAAFYTRALALQPRWEEGWWSLGTLEYDQDHYAKAALDFERVLGLNPAHGTAHAMLGLCQFELHQDEPALKNLLAAERFGIVKDEQLRNVALYHLGLLQLRARKYRDAHETLLQLARDGVRTKELIVALGQSALLTRPQESLPEPNDGVIEGAGQAEARLATKDFDRAKQIYAGLTTAYPDYPNLHFAYGRLLLEAHETDEAVKEFQSELERDPKNVNSLLEIAAVRYQVDSQDGLKYAEEAVKLAPGMPFAHYLLGLLRLDTGNAAGAIPEFELARKAFPKEAQVYFSLGSAYARAGRKAKAAKARAEFVRLNAHAPTQAGSNFYGERPSGISQGQLRAADRGNDRENVRRNPPQ